MFGKDLADILHDQADAETDILGRELAADFTQILAGHFLEKISGTFPAVRNDPPGAAPNFGAGIIFYEEREPVFFGQAIIIGEGDDLAGAKGKAGIPGERLAAARFVHVDGLELLGEFGGFFAFLAFAAIHDDDLKIRVILFGQGGEGLHQIA